MRAGLLVWWQGGGTQAEVNIKVEEWWRPGAVSSDIDDMHTAELEAPAPMLCTTSSHTSSNQGGK